MKSVIRSIKPYWVFLIIARKMGWDIPQEKTIEVGKNQPLAKDWNRKTFIYCSTDKKSFNRIPKEYQPLMRPLLGKVIGEFICDRIYKIKDSGWQYLIENDIALTNRIARESCLLYDDLRRYLGTKDGYGWHISELKVYNKPKEIGAFFTPLGKRPSYQIECPPQTWCYTEAA